MLEDFNAGVEQVYSRTNWQELPNPFSYASEGTSAAELAAMLVADPAEADPVYRRVRDRGIAQTIFRKALLIAYEGQCAMCGLSRQPALEAAHLLPWADLSRSERLDVRSGLLLCSTHHRLFDAGLITIDQAGAIRVTRHDEGDLSEADNFMITDLEGKAAKLPAHAEHQPSAKLVDRRVHVMQGV